MNHRKQNKIPIAQSLDPQFVERAESTTKTTRKIKQKRGKKKRERENETRGVN